MNFMIEYFQACKNIYRSSFTYNDVTPWQTHHKLKVLQIENALNTPNVPNIIASLSYLKHAQNIYLVVSLQLGKIL